MKSTKCINHPTEDLYVTALVTTPGGGLPKKPRRVGLCYGCAIRLDALARLKDARREVNG